MLPATHTEFLQRLNKKHRYWLRRLEKQIETDFPNQVSYRSFTDGQRLDELMKDLECVASKTYQRCLGAGFRNDAEYARRLALERGKLGCALMCFILATVRAHFGLARYTRGCSIRVLLDTILNIENTNWAPLVFMKMVEQCAPRKQRRLTMVWATPTISSALVTKAGRKLR